MGDKPIILVLGASGMLGHKVFLKLRQSMPEYTVIGTMRKFQESRVTAFCKAGEMIYFNAFEAISLSIKPDVIINCIGAIKQRKNYSVADMIYLNAAFPHALAQYCIEHNIRLIHISTDCVFAPCGFNHFNSDDPPNATDLYGKTKGMGELTTYAHALTLRTSIIGRELGGTRYGLLEWFLGQARDGKDVNGYDVMWNGQTTNGLTEIIAEIINRFPQLTGVVNVGMTKVISKFDLLCLLNKIYGLNATITKKIIKPTEQRILASDKFYREILGLTEIQVFERFGYNKALQQMRDEDLELYLKDLMP